MTENSNLEQLIPAMAKSAMAAAGTLSTLSRKRKDAALARVAELLNEQSEAIQKENR